MQQYNGYKLYCIFDFTVQLYLGGGRDTAASVQTLINVQRHSVVKYIRIDRQSCIVPAQRHLHTAAAD